MSSEEISEWIAFDQLKDNEYKATLQTATMSEEERNMQLKRLLGFKG